MAPVVKQAAPATPAAEQPALAWPWATLLTAAVALAVFLVRGADGPLVCERPAILHGEIWRLWTGNWVHFGASHLGWNLAVLVAAGGWAERIAPRPTRWLLALAPGLIGVVLLGIEPALTVYGGLSGVAAGVLALLALVQLRRSPGDRAWWWAVLGLLALKITAEALAGHALFARFADPELRPVPLAHGVGVVTALAVHRGFRRI